MNKKECEAKKTEKFKELEFRIKNLENELNEKKEMLYNLYDYFNKVRDSAYEKNSELENKMTKNMNIFIRFNYVKDKKIENILTNKKIYNEFMNEEIDKFNERLKFENGLGLTFAQKTIYIKDIIYKELNINQIIKILDRFDKYETKQKEYDKYKENNNEKSN